MNFETAMEALDLSRIKTVAQLNSRNTWKSGDSLSKRSLMIERVNILRTLILRQQAPSIPITPPSNNSQGTFNTL